MPCRRHGIYVYIKRRHILASSMPIIKQTLVLYNRDGEIHPVKIAGFQTIIRDISKITSSLKSIINPNQITNLTQYHLNNNRDKSSNKIISTIKRNHQ